MVTSHTDDDGHRDCRALGTRLHSVRLTLYRSPWRHRGVTATPTTHTTVTVLPAVLAVSPNHAGSVNCSVRSVGYPAIKIRNTGEQTLNWQATAAGPGAFVSPASGTLVAGKAQTLSVRQRGTTRAAATVAITSNGGSATLAFYCVGSPPPPPPPQLAVSPTQATTVNCSGSNVPYPSITVRNIGGQALSWNAGVPVANASVTPSSGRLGQGQSQQLTVTQPGPVNTVTNVTITSNGGNAVVRFTCAAPGLHGNMVVNPTSLALGNYLSGARRPLPSGMGMKGPLPLPVVPACARRVPSHLANSIVFGRSVVKRSHG